MSASNWSPCPACRDRIDKRLREARRRMERAYGTVPKAVYERLRQRAERRADLKDTLREDWQVGTDDGGRFHVTYRCECQEPGCRFGFEYRHEEQVDLGTAAAGGGCRLTPRPAALDTEDDDA